eukprot:1139419-Pelagomonas_calceolata.AAC.4
MQMQGIMQISTPDLLTPVTPRPAFKPSWAMWLPTKPRAPNITSLGKTEVKPSAALEALFVSVNEASMVAAVLWAWREGGGTERNKSSGQCFISNWQLCTPF